jgi:hypothetical protein
MSGCKHEKLKVDTFTDKAGLPAQKVFTFLRCVACGEIFPIKPDNKVEYTGALSRISEDLKYINQTLSTITGKLK